ncbi:glutathione S-transferase C-terminal-like protein [Lyophyllum atratum]|nr:glutathione S-transferase C-terminal-like protein [Lyophyllum atratum]
MTSTLWTTPAQGSGKIIRAVAALGGITSLELPAGYEHYVDNKKPEFLEKFPHGKIPALEEADGFKVFEGVAIARYVAGLAPNAGLLGKDLAEAALIDQWIHLTESEVDQWTNLIGQLLRGVITPYSKPIHTTFAERQLRALKTLNAHLATRTFFVGERITLADIYIATQVRRAATVTFDAPLRAELAHLVRHAETVVNQPKIKEFFEPVEYVQKALTYVAPKKEAK